MHSTTDPQSTATPAAGRPRKSLASVIVRLAGDSGDGIQIIGGQLTDTSAMVGNDISTLPDFPAEIRAPAGSLAGVSGFQIQFAEEDIYTPGDEVHTLVAMNPAALKSNLGRVAKGGTLIVNTDSLSATDLRKANYATNPLEDGSLSGYRVVPVALSRLAIEAVKDLGLTPKQAERCKNFLALGVVYWLYDRPMEPTIRSIERKFGGKDDHTGQAIIAALKAGYYYGETCELFAEPYHVAPAALPPGTYRKVTGNEAAALGLAAAAELAGKEAVYCSYPITPASDILHDLSALKNQRVTTFQAEDEIAAAGAAIGAAFGGAMASTGTSGPGMALKQEALGLAVMTELPLVVINVQRGGPSTGLPTKTEQADLFQAVYGRNSECPIPVIAPAFPGDCFDAVVEASRVAVRYMTPVIVLSDGYVGNSAEPWLVPDISKMPRIDAHHPTTPNSAKGMMPYLRNADLSRPWAVPGMPGLEHRVGGLEKADVTGAVSHDPANHELMVRMRAKKVEGIECPGKPYLWTGPKEGKLLVIGWGSTYGAIKAATNRAREAGMDVSAMHIRMLNPLPRDLGDILKRFSRILVPEINLGQLRTILRSQYLVDAAGYNRVRGQPFTVNELVKAMAAAIEGRDANPPMPAPGTAPAAAAVVAAAAAPAGPAKPSDYASDQEVRWCPGCGDFAILMQVKKVFAKLGIDRSKTVFVSGIGCSSRFPYYMSTYGFHSIHGRALTIATGLRLARPDLDIWVVTGDGDGLSIGGNHMIHFLRRNVGAKVLLFNNRIYGLTKGQYSPTSPFGKKTKTSPMGTPEAPIRPLSLALASEATFVARTVDVDLKHMEMVLERAAAHKGSALVEIYQNCVIFNDGEWTYATDKVRKDDGLVYVEHGKPMVFGKDKNKAIALDGLSPKVVAVGADQAAAPLLHDEHAEDPSLAFLLSRFSQPDMPDVMGILRDVDHPCYEETVWSQAKAAVARHGAGSIGDAIKGSETWTVKGPEKP